MCEGAFPLNRGKTGPVNEPKTLFTGEEICQFYDVSRSTFEKWLALGLVPSPVKRVQRSQGGKSRRYWTHEQVLSLNGMILDFRAGLATSELAQKYKPNTNRG